MTETWYRFEDHLYSTGVGLDGEWSGGSILRVHLREFAVARRTPKGAWLDLGFGELRWVATGARKRYACPTLEEARESFRARKRRQLRIYEARAARARRALAEFEREATASTSR